MEMSGHGQMVSSGRQIVYLDEYVATVVNAQGNVIANKALMVVANNHFLIRGPEKNPFWHGNDWLVYAPLVPTPLSVYGRSYMEDFGSIAHTFNELTNMLLDAVFTSSLKAWSIVPGMLLNPDQVAEGISPNKLFLLEEGMRPEDFAKALDLGQLPPESFKLWQAIKNELSEAAHVNEIGMGQFAPHSRTTKGEIDSTQQSSSAMIRSMAQTVETRFLDPILDLTWKTGLQHASPSDSMLSGAAGEEMYKALLSKRKELIKRPVTFQARGISNLIKKSSTLKSLIAIFQVVASSPELAKEFFNQVPVDKFVSKLFELSDVDITSMQASDREKAMRQLAEPMQQAADQSQGAGPAQGPGANQMADLAKSMGVLQQQRNNNVTHAVTTSQTRQNHLLQGAHKDQQHEQELHHTNAKTAQEIRHAELEHEQTLRHNENMHIVQVAQAAQPKPEPKKHEAAKH
jgi:hypothetical protein